MTRLTALIICGAPEAIECLAGGPTADGKFAGWIFYNEDRGDLPGGMRDIRPRPLVNTEPIYGSSGEAVAAMQEIVRQIQENEKKIFGEEEKS